MGMGGITGLDYPPLFEIMRRKGLEGEAWDEMFQDIRVIEISAINASHTPA